MQAREGELSGWLVTAQLKAEPLSRLLFKLGVRVVGFNP